MRERRPTRVVCCRRRRGQQLKMLICCSGRWHHQQLEPWVSHLTDVSCQARMAEPADMWGGLGQMYCKLCKHGDVRMWRYQTHDNTRTMPPWRDCLWGIRITRGNQTIHTSACRNQKWMIVLVQQKLDDPDVWTCGRGNRGVFLSPSPRCL